MTTKTLMITVGCIILLGTGVIIFFVLGTNKYPKTEIFSTNTVKTEENIDVKNVLPEESKKPTPKVTDLTEIPTPSLDATRVMFVSPLYDADYTVRVKTGETVLVKVAAGKDITSVNVVTRIGVNELLKHEYVDVKTLSVINGYAEYTYIVPETSLPIFIEAEGLVQGTLVSNFDRESKYNLPIEGSIILLSKSNIVRSRGADSAVKANLANIRAQAEIAYDTATPYSYDAVCTDATVVSAGTNAASAGGGTFVCNDTATAWAASTALKTSGAGFWCVDSIGVLKVNTTALGTATAC